jgi:hypothetical protein
MSENTLDPNVLDFENMTPEQRNAQEKINAYVEEQFAKLFPSDAAAVALAEYRRLAPHGKAQDPRD